MEPQSPARGAAIALLAAGLLALAPAAGAHIVYGTTTLHQLVAGADVVARARIVDPNGVIVVDALPTQRPVVEAQLLDVLKGDAQPGPVRFAQHGHGAAEFAKGEEVLLFLRRIERTRELARLRGAEGLRYVSLQQHDAKFALTPSTREPLLSAVLAYAELETLPDPAARVAALQRVTVAHLASGEPRLAASAVQDLVILEDVPLVSAADLPVLEPLLDDPKSPIGLRVALLVELERRGLVEGPSHWVKLLEGAQGRDLAAAVRAAGRHQSPAVTGKLVAILEGQDAEAASVAAVALGFPGNEVAVAPLARVLAEGDSRQRMAAIRGLGRVATPAALRALAAAADSHPDAATRRRAGAEVKVLSARSALAAPSANVDGATAPAPE
jgi:hypothetical protein